MLYVIETCFEDYLSKDYVQSWNCETCGNSNGTKDSFDENDIEDVVRVFEDLGWYSDYFLEKLFELVDYTEEEKAKIKKAIEDKEKEEED